MAYTLVSVVMPAIPVTLPPNQYEYILELKCKAMGLREAMEYFRAAQSDVDMLEGLIQAWNVKIDDEAQPVTRLSIARLLDADSTETLARDIAVEYIKALEARRKGN